MEGAVKRPSLVWLSLTFR